MGVNSDPIETQRLIKTQEQPILKLVEIRWWALSLRYLLYSLGNEDLKNLWAERWHDETLMQGNTVSGIPIGQERVHQLIIQKVILGGAWAWDYIISNCTVKVYSLLIFIFRRLEWENLWFDIKHFVNIPFNKKRGNHVHLEFNKTTFIEFAFTFIDTMYL